ncbi:MAG: hypothetical protein ISR44_09190 [Rhodospirillales bacterium]|nr:hypothetical protein [Rhodospirillales bacterium]
MQKATLIFSDRTDLSDRGVIEMKIWRVPVSVPPSDHGLKYSLYFGRDGERIVGYDNERGKGDHKHIRGQEQPYQFVSVRQLVDDFKADVERNRT